MISKTRISKRIKNKNSFNIVETIELAKKNKHLGLAKKISGPRSRYKNINLDELDKIEGNKIIIIGKVLGSGEINKKISVAALGFSETAMEKLNKSGCEVKSVKEEIEKNKDLKGVEIIG